MTCFQRNLLTVLAVIACLVLVTNASPGLLGDLTANLVTELWPATGAILEIVIILGVIGLLWKLFFGKKSGGK